jgi:hypothetical protein
MPPIIQTWLFQSAVIFFILGSVAGLFAGALLLFHPHRFYVISAMLNRWISTRTLDKALESSFALDPWLYRYRRATGTLILIGAMFVLFYFTVQLDRAEAIASLAKHFHYYPSLVAGLLDALVMSSLIGALSAVYVALCLMFRPSLLRGFEETANQWLSLRRAMKPMEIQRDNMDRYVQRYARQVGIFLLLGSLYTLLLLGFGLTKIG